MFGDEYFEIQNRWIVLQIIMGDKLESTKLLQEMRNDESRSKFQRAVVSNNLAMMNYFNYHDEVKNKFGNIDEIPQYIRFGETQVLPLLKDSIKYFETVDERSESDLSILNSLLNRDAQAPQEFYEEDEKAKFFSILESPFTGVSLTNICEHLLLR
jgi:hypothetical protein